MATMNVLLICGDIRGGMVRGDVEITDAEDCVYTAKGRLQSGCREKVRTAIPTLYGVSK
jgi:hypothetical protein